MEARFRVLAGLALIGALLAIPGIAAGAGSAQSASDGIQSTQAYFVQLAGTPSALGGSKAADKAARDAFYKNAAAMGVGVTQRQAFDTLWQGVSVNVSAADAGALATVPGVQAVYPVQQLSLDAGPTGPVPPESSDGEVLSPAGNSVIDLTHSTTTIGAVAANAAGWTGSGIKVGIIDSGVDYTHPDLGGCFGSGCKVAGGYDLVGDTFDSNSKDSTYQPIPHPDADPFPCDPNLADAIAQQPGAGTSDAAHGTHVSGIVAAKAASATGVTGVAPEATLYMYRVFGCNGSTSDDIMIAAMERAFSDGVRVINMSIGDAFNNFASAPDAQAASALTRNGVVVVASAGNSGANGLFSTGAPSVGEGVISVASTNNVSFAAPSFDAVSGSTTIHVAYFPLQTTATPPTSGSAGDIVYVGRGCSADPSLPLATDDPYLADPSGKVALIIRGLCTFKAKYERAVAAGAKAVVIMNDGADPTRFGLFAGGGVTDKGVLGVTISNPDGLAIRAATQPVTLNWTDKTVEATDPTAGQISSFSSYGLASDLALKPDISAPGGNIKSTWPLSQDGGYNVISGTSMASPHVAGSAADYLQAHPTATPAQVASALKDTAAIIINPNTLLGAARENPDHEGAGVVHVDRAINAPVRVSPSSFSTGDQPTTTATLTLSNSGSTALTYTVGNLSAGGQDPVLADGSLGHMPYTFGYYATAPNVFTRSASSVTVAAGGTASVTVSVAPPVGWWDDGSLWGGYVSFTPAAGQSTTQQLIVPYAGFVGDYQTLITPLASGNCSLPMLAHFGAATDTITCDKGTPAITGFTGAPTGGTYEQPKKDPVVLLWHLDFQVQELKVTLVDAATGAPVTEGGRNPVLFDVTGVARNSTVSAFSGMVWDGTSSFLDNGAKSAQHRKAVPGGTYKLVLTVTKVKSFTDTRTNQTQTWTSPAFTLRGE